MNLDAARIQEEVAKLNASRRKDQLVRVERIEGDQFTLSFPNRAMPEGQCIDQDFTEIQWAIHEKDQTVTSIVGGRHEPADDRYYIDYELVRWD